MPLSSIRMMPSGRVCSTPPPVPTELNISISTPARLSATPPAFLKVIGSLRKMAAKHIVNTGGSVPRTERSMELVIVVATRNENCGTKSPSTEARAILARSPAGTFSRGIKSDISQNRAEAPMALMVKSTDGVMTCEFAMSLQKIILKPKIIYAPATARCPTSFPLSAIALPVVYKVHTLITLLTGSSRTRCKNRYIFEKMFRERRLLHRFARARRSSSARNARALALCSLRLRAKTCLPEKSELAQK